MKLVWVSFSNNANAHYPCGSLSDIYIYIYIYILCIPHNNVGWLDSELQIGIWKMFCVNYCRPTVEHAK